MFKKRARTLFIIFSAIFFCLACKIAYIQFFSQRPLAESAFRQTLSNNSVEKLRGNILDRNGIPFTNRETRYTALIKPSYMPDSEDERLKVSEALNIRGDILDNLTSKSRPLTIETNKTGSDEILKLKTDWVSILYSLNRYDSGTLARHIIGYLNKKDRVGQAGIEKAYEDVLRDNSVYEIGTVTDAAKNPIKGLGYRLKNWSSGEKASVKLTLDYHIQKIVEEVMDKNGISGAVVVEDVVTGDVLAMASKPDFDQNLIESYLDSSEKELFNKATTAYNLGSVFKIRFWAYSQFF